MRGKTSRARGRRLLRLDRLLELSGGDIGDADGLLALMFRNTSLMSDGFSGLAGSQMLIVSPPIKLFEQFAHAPDRAGLNAISENAKRVVVGHLGIGSPPMRWPDRRCRAPRDHAGLASKPRITLASVTEMGPSVQATGPDPKTSVSVRHGEIGKNFWKKIWVPSGKPP
jgi:hypothetical protein